MPRTEIPRARLNRVWELAKRIEQIEGIAMSPAAIAAIDAALAESGTPPDPALVDWVKFRFDFTDGLDGWEFDELQYAFIKGCLEQAIKAALPVPPEGSPERQTS